LLASRKYTANVPSLISASWFFRLSHILAKYSQPAVTRPCNSFIIDDMLSTP
jgi:hypothetical protein